ncbi:MAG: ribosome maturation factor RimP [Coriobacteriia bacterium]|nr:ribosome maturation factor RimP [Coriobacteriia bacterium]
MPNKKEYSLIEAIETIGAEVDPDVDIVTVKMVGSAKAPVVRVYIDYPGGVTFDVLAETQKWISEILDEIDPFTGSYTLEVSSPGPDRPLRTPKHFEGAKGETVKIKTSEAVEGRKNFTGELLNVSEKQVVLALEEGNCEIPFEYIAKANIRDK